ncbi:uncharacterized protein J3D65DRAFT_341895 [Phyllosticta citribraziliensis]|uniref:PAC domain-containing protein n=1 Tax=Phyllosticta citribraziliensis TaxID=989973 RepID=A0ABR1LU71_9PEZI
MTTSGDIADSAWPIKPEGSPLTAATMAHDFAATNIQDHGTNLEDPPQDYTMANSFSMGSDDECAPFPPDIPVTPKRLSSPEPNRSAGLNVPARSSKDKPKRLANLIFKSKKLPKESPSCSTLSSMPIPENRVPEMHEPKDSPSSNSTVPSTPDHDRVSMSADSVISYETQASSIGTLPPLQERTALSEADKLEPVMEDDPRNFDLVSPQDEGLSNQEYSLEKRSELIMSKKHLEAIFADSEMLQKFISFLSATRPESIPLLVYYLDALKALRAINYANAVAEALEPLSGLEFSRNPARPTVNAVLEDKANAAFETLVKDDLPAYVTHIWTQVVNASVHMRITGTQPPHLREASEGLAETFCLTDPSRKDNPIIFASSEFHRVTQYGVSYAIGRNCRFLQGPRTNPHSIERLRQATKEGKELNEVILNYRRDGSTFLNLLMMAPLLDSKGNVRYFIGSQVDVSGLARDCTDLPALKRVIDEEENAEVSGKETPLSPLEEKDEFQELSEMFNQAELDCVRKHGGRMHQEVIDELDDTASIRQRPRLLLKDPSPTLSKMSEPFGPARSNGKLSGIYQHYLLVRPHPTLRILFTSPSLRVPGMLQSLLMDHIGGSEKVQRELEGALADKRSVTAKIRWISSSRSHDEGRPRWIHCTPLFNQKGDVGVWTVILVDDHKAKTSMDRKVRIAPPVSTEIVGENYDGPGANRNFSRRASTPFGKANHIIDVAAANRLGEPEQQQHQKSEGENGRHLHERDGQLSPYDTSPRSVSRLSNRRASSPFAAGSIKSNDVYKL